MRFPRAVRVLGRFYSTVEVLAGGYVCGVLVVFVMLLVTGEVISRAVFSYSFMGEVDIIRLIMATITFLSLGFIQQIKAHIRIDLLDHKFSKGQTGRIVQRLILVLYAMTCALLCYITSEFAIKVYVEHRLTMVIEWPYWPVAALVPIGFFFMVVRLSMQIQEHLRKCS